MKRSILVNQLQDTIHKLLTLIVCKGSERPGVAEVARFIGVTSRTTERTLPGNFN
jgi:hypothetical protein